MIIRTKLAPMKETKLLDKSHDAHEKRKPGRPRKHPVPAVQDTIARPFQNVQEAWFWYCRMQGERDAGFKPNGNGAERPCDIDDIALIVTRLRRNGIITMKHISTLTKYGQLQSLPDRRVDPYGLKLWDSALDRIHTHMVAKGIVELPVNKNHDGLLDDVEEKQ